MNRWAPRTTINWPPTLMCSTPYPPPGRKIWGIYCKVIARRSVSPANSTCPRISTSTKSRSALPTPVMAVTRVLNRSPPFLTSITPMAWREPTRTWRSTTNGAAWSTSRKTRMCLMIACHRWPVVTPPICRPVRWAPVTRSWAPSHCLKGPISLPSHPMRVFPSSC